MRTAPAIALALMLVLGGCGGGGAASSPPRETNDPDHEPTASLLVVDGDRVTGDEDRAGEPARTTVPATRAAATNRVLAALATVADDDPWPQPALLPDGTIDDGDDPFSGVTLEVQGAPLEDDAATTRAIDAWSVLLRRVDRPQWDTLVAGDLRSPYDPDARDPTLGSLVRISVERCGGARSVATGAVVANETVVTTVHAIESPARRVRVSAATGAPQQRLPAMVRYLDVDDDVAVLKVPGLRATPLSFHAPSGTEPVGAFAYGVTRGHLEGTVRREPAVVAMREEAIDLEQPDGFARRIADRSVFPIVAPMGAGFASAVVTATNDPSRARGFGLHGLVRARVPFRSQNAGIVVPARVLQEAVAASQGLDPWFEHAPGGCPQWHR